MKRSSPNPLAQDRTRCATIRRLFAADVRRRFAALRRSLTRLIVIEDAFGLSPVTFHSPPSRWRFATDAGKLQAFRVWLDGEIQAIIQGAIAGQAWWLRHVQAAYERGLNRAFDDVRRPALHGTGEIGGARAEYLRRVLSGVPTSPFVDSTNQTTNARHGLRDFSGRFVSKKVLALSARLAVELKGATDAMAQKIARALISGLERGDSIQAIAGAVSAAADVGRRRASLIATTEVTRAHAAGQLDGMEELGYDEVELVAEWTAQNDACPACSEMDGQVFSLADARGLIPLHPTCACSWSVTGGVP